MPIRQIESPEAKYLAATDILIADMSDINYEVLVYDRPIILLANEWLKMNFPDIGIKTSLDELGASIERSLTEPMEYQKERKVWLIKTIYKPFENASERVLKIAISKSRYKKPTIVIIHGDSDVRKTNLVPLYDEAMRQNIEAMFVSHPSLGVKEGNERIYIAAHFEDLHIKGGYKVHLDHGLKGKGTANVEIAKKDYMKNHYFPLIDLHITAGEIGNERTKMLLGPNGNRAIIAGYPKADHLVALNTPENRADVFNELGFDNNKPLITYAPAGRENYEKPGGSFCPEVLEKLTSLSEEYNYNILVKLKCAKRNIAIRVLRKLSRMLHKSL